MDKLLARLVKKERERKFKLPMSGMKDRTSLKGRSLETLEG